MSQGATFGAGHSIERAMPRSKREGLVYGVLMSVFMTCGMELYNNAVKQGMNLVPGGFSSMDWSVVTGAAEELPFMIPVVFVLSNLFGNKLGQRIAVRFIDPERDSAFIRSCITIACTTLVMCPTMSLFASVLFNVILAGRPVVELPMIWLGTVYKNFTMALLWNLFAASPLTRVCFAALFRREGATGTAPATERV